MFMSNRGFSNLGILVITVSLCAFSYNAWQYLNDQAARNWPITSGRIVKTDASVHSSLAEYGPVRFIYWPHGEVKVDYCYEIDGKPFSGHADIIVQAPTYHEKSQTDLVAGQYTAGTAVAVYYDRANLAQSNIVPGSGARTYLVWMFMSVVFFVASLFPTGSLRRRYPNNCQSLP
jgi:Protein of unknown function (DUF3592)